VVRSHAELLKKKHEEYTAFSSTHGIQVKVTGDGRQVVILTD
jgi:hypothetical protein